MKLGITGLVASALARPLYAQPIIYSGYEDFHLYPHPIAVLGGNSFVGEFTFALADGNFGLGPFNFAGIRDFLVMFSDKYVEKNGRYFAVKNSQGNGALRFDRMPPYKFDVLAGLYELLDPNSNDPSFCNYSSRCVVFKLVAQVENIGQIIAAPEKYEPMQIIGVDQVTNKIYGFTPKNNYAYWERKQTVWGDAKSGSLSSTDGEVIGLSSNNRVRGLIMLSAKIDDQNLTILFILPS